MDVYEFFMLYAFVTVFGGLGLLTIIGNLVYSRKDENNVGVLKRGWNWVCEKVYDKLKRKFDTDVVYVEAEIIDCD